MSHKTVMSKNNPLTSKEISELENYLEKYAKTLDSSGYRIDSLSALEGYLTAVISSPKNYPTHFWLEPLFNFKKAKMKTVQKVLDLVIKHYNSIVYTLNIDPENTPFEPYFDFFDSPDGQIVVTDFWCQGYLRFVERAESFFEIEEANPHLLRIFEGAAFMFMFAQEQEGTQKTPPSPELCAENADAVLDAVYTLHYLYRNIYLKELDEISQQDSKVAIH